jgi:PAS domain S-box-containing protein
MEHKLRESAKLLATTLKSIGDAVIATDKDGCITFINSMAQFLTGWTKEEALGRELSGVLNIINAETREEIENPVTKAVEGSAVIDWPINNVLLVDRDGKETPIEDSVSPIKCDDESVVGTVLSIRDISQRKKIEKDLLRMQKLESMCTLAGGIANDFNNFLTAILGNIALIKMNTQLDDEGLERLSLAEKACDRAKNVTQQLLAFSMGGTSVKKTASIAELLKDTIETALADSQVTCEFSLPADLWPVEIDIEQVRLAISYLIKNAIESMPQGGTIEVQGANRSLSPGNPLGLKERMYVNITIKDHGSGMSQEHLTKIFDPFFTTKQNGRGLGLTSTYTIIKSHNGHISVESELGTGTTFAIYLPATEKQHRPKQNKTSKVPRGRRKILVMDGDDIVREICGEICQRLGYAVELAEDGSQAIELYRKAWETGQPFDGMIVDLTIPNGIGGKETVKIVRKINPDVKMIVASGYAHGPVMEGVNKYGFTSVITKPYKLEELREALTDILK